MVEKVVLAISTGRTGTKTLASFFASNFENVEAYHQPQYSRYINIISNMNISGVLPDSIYYPFLNATRIKRILRSNHEYYVEVNSMLYLASHYLRNKLLDVGKEVYIVHIIRDPRTFITSMLNWKHGRIKSYIAHTLIPFWQPVGFLAGEFSVFEWVKMTEFEKTCWYWKFKNETILRLHKDYKKFISIRFEDIFTSDIDKRAKTLKRLLTFVGLPYDDSMVKYFKKKQNVSKKKFPTWPYWSHQQCKLIQEICGDLMKKYGYGNEREWIKKLEDTM